MKLLVNTPGGVQEIIEIGHGGGYFDLACVLWDERKDGPLPAITLGGMVRIGNALNFSQATMNTCGPAAKKAAAAAQWGQIKAARERCKDGGVQVSGNWFHSDVNSRIQLIALVMLGASIPANLQWKTMAKNPDGSAIYVTLTRELANQVFLAIVALDQAAFNKAEEHRVAMEAAADPELYNFGAGWPATYTGG